MTTDQIRTFSDTELDELIAPTFPCELWPKCGCWFWCGSIESTAPSRLTEGDRLALERFWRIDRWAAFAGIVLGLLMGATGLSRSAELNVTIGPSWTIKPEPCGGECTPRRSADYERRWREICQPRDSVGEFGVVRVIYAKRGCAYGIPGEAQ